jgi:hypothetical protein
LQPGRCVQVLKCCNSVQFLIASLAKHLGIPTAGTGPSGSVADACLASLSASFSLPLPLLGGCHIKKYKPNLTFKRMSPA